MYWINRSYIQNKRFNTAERNFRPNCQVWLLGESRYLSFIPPTGRVQHKAFLGGSGCKTVPWYTWWVKKCPRSRYHSPKKGHLRRQVINLAPPWRVRAWGTSSQGLRMPVLMRLTWTQLTGIHVIRPRLTACRTRTHPTISVYRPTQTIEVCPRSELGEMSVFIVCPTNRTSMAHGLF